MLVLGKTPDFERWLNDLEPKDRSLVETRLESFEEGYFPKDDKSVGGKVMETRFMGRGLRVYYTKLKIQGRDIILAAGEKGTRRSSRGTSRRRRH